MIITITFTLILFFPFAHSCWSWCPNENVRICNNDWISLVKIIDSNLTYSTHKLLWSNGTFIEQQRIDSQHIRYTLKHLYVFKKNGTFTSWRCKEILGYPESFCTGRLYWPFTLDMKPLALSDKYHLSIFFDAHIGSSIDPMRLRVGETYIISGPRTTDPLETYACISIAHQVDDLSTDALVRKLASITPEECTIIMDEAKKSNPKYREYL